MGENAMTEKQILKEAEKQRRKEERELKKAERERVAAEKLALKSRPKKTEAELVRDYADKVIKGKIAQGWVGKRFNTIFEGKSVNKNLWLDTDFFFSVVFQSSEQKYDFLEKMNFQVDATWDGSQVQIVNGIKLAEQFGIQLRLETAAEFPLPNAELLPIVLDYETIDHKGE
jgi:hypothetical protein